MTTESGVDAISSKEVISLTSISRATLNNYISLKLIPPPSIRKPAEPGGPTKIGYFPVWVVERIEKIRVLKASGMRMSEIAAYFSEQREEIEVLGPEVLGDFTYRSIDRLVFPAILVNERWEIIWINEMAEELIFRERVHEIPSAAMRNILRLFVERGLAKRFSNWKEILRSHMRLAKRELKEEDLEQVCRQVADFPLEQLKQLWREVEPLSDRPITQQELVLKPRRGKTTHHTLFSSDFREGTLLFYTPVSMQLDQILDLLMGRERIIKAVVSRRIPSLTPLCILAGRLESGLHLRTALPPREYFDLINQIILNSHQCFKDFGGTAGRSVQEGVVGFFISAPDSPRDYLQQAMLCGQSLKQMISSLDKRWKYKKAWNNTLRMNMGIHCGSEWLGTIPSSVAFELTVMGNTLMNTVKLSEFGETGSIWASKKVIENLSPSHRQRVEFGIRLGPRREQFISPGIYSQVQELLNSEELEHRTLGQIRNLAVTEIIHVHPTED